MVGMKGIAVKLSGAQCPEFSPSFVPPSQLHDKITEKLIQQLERAGLKCDREIPTKLQTKTQQLSGRIDLVCGNGSQKYIIEVKSYPLSRATLSDYVQLWLYCSSLSSTTPSLRCLLAYRGMTSRDDNIVFVEIPSKKPQNEHEVKAALTQKKKPGLECFKCTHIDSCPHSLKKFAREVEGDRGLKPKGADLGTEYRELVGEIYRELLKEEWCLMRHGASCTSYYYSHAEQKLYNLPVYVTTSGITFHDPDEVLTPLHILAVAARVAGRVKLPSGHGERRVDEVLLGEGLLIEKGCRINVSVVNEKFGLVLKLMDESVRGDEGGEVKGAEPERNFLRLVDVLRKYEELQQYLGDAESIGLPKDIGGLLSSISQVCYKTFHGEYVRLLRNTGPLPGRSVVLEAYLLPFIEDVIGERNKGLKEEVVRTLEEYFCSSGRCDKGVSSIAIKVTESLRDERGENISAFSRFQAEGLKRLLKAEQDGKPFFFLLTSPPGAGKTFVFMLYALARAVRNILEGRDEKIVIMYPTKTLAKQQLQLLIYTVEALNAELAGLGRKIKLALYDGDSNRVKRLSGKELEGHSLRGLKCRSGELKYDKSGAVLCGSARVDWVTEVDVEDADIVVTNPYKLSSDLLEPNANWVEKVGLIIFDEAHHFLESTKLDFFTALLHRLIIRKLGNGGKADLEELCEKAPDVVFSSATITSSGMPLGDGEDVAFRGICGFLRAKKPDDNEAKNALDKLAEIVLGAGLAKCYEKKYVDFYQWAEEETSGKRKLTLPLVLFTIPEQSPTGTAAEASVTTMIFSRASLMRNKIFRRGLTAMLFIDDKELQRELKSHIVNRLLKFELSPADKLLVRPHIERNLGQQASHVSKAGLYAVKDLLNANAVHELESYSHLSLYCVKKSDLVRAIKSARGEYNGNDSSLSLECYLRAKEDAAKMIKQSENGKLQTGYVPLLVHNADLRLEKRSEVERILESWEPQWDLVLATSALEVGVNVRNAGVILQYGLPALPEVVVQRFGRGGRSEDTLYVSVGVLMPRHTGEDVALIDEDYAVQRLFGFRPSFLHDERYDARYKSILMLVGFNAFAINAYVCSRGRDVASLYIDYSSVMLATPSVENLQKEVIDTLYNSCTICSSSTNLSEISEGIITHNLRNIENWTRENCESEIPTLRKICGNIVDYLCQLCSSTNCNRRIMEKLLDIVREALSCIGPLRKEMASLNVEPISYVLSIYKSLLMINQCKRTNFRKCCMISHLSVFAQPPMSHPYLIVPTLQVYTVDLGVDKEKRTAQIDEMYDIEIPLRIRDI